MDKWSRLNPDDEVDVPEDMTRLTLDTIALCGFGYRFNSFYRDTPHPFVAGDGAHPRRARRTGAGELPIQRELRIRARRQLRGGPGVHGRPGRPAHRASAAAQGDAADNTDLLGRMLTGVDKQSGEQLPDENIGAQCITFLDRRPRDHQRAAVLRASTTC